MPDKGRKCIRYKRKIGVVATRSGRRRNKSGCSAPRSLVRNLANREHPFGKTLHSRRSPQTGRAQGSLERRMVASKPAAKGTPDTSSGQIVGVEKEAKKRAVWRQAIEASTVDRSARDGCLRDGVHPAGLPVFCPHSYPLRRLRWPLRGDHPRANVRWVRPSTAWAAPGQGKDVEDPQRYQSYLASPILSRL